MKMSYSKYRILKEHKMGEVVINQTQEEKDLSVIIRDNLLSVKHIKMYRETYKFMQNIKT